MFNKPTSEQKSNLSNIVPIRVTKFVIIIVINLVTLCCATKVRLRRLKKILDFWTCMPNLISCNDLDWYIHSKKDYLFLINKFIADFQAFALCPSYFVISCSNQSKPSCWAFLISFVNNFWLNNDCKHL